MERPDTSKTMRRLGVGTLVAAALVNIGPVASVNAYEAPEVTRTLDKPSNDWKLQHSDTFNDGMIDSYWKVMDNTSFPWDRFSQYRQFAVSERGGNLILTTRRHCLAPGETMDLSNAQAEPCAAGETESYSAGRVEGLKDIGGDFMVTIKARMPLGKIGTREAIWMNNLQEIGQPNGGYCVQGSSEPNDEKDLVENYGDRNVRASHHMYCEDGELAEVPRAKKIGVKQRKKFNEYTVMRIGNKTEFFVNDEPIPTLASNGKQSIDTPRDFKGVSKDEYWATRQYLEGLIFCTRAFDEDTANPLFSRPDSSKPFPPRSMQIDTIKTYTLER